MMSLKRIFGLMLLFLLFETAVAVVTTLWFRDTNVFVACAAMTALALLAWLSVALILRFFARQRATAAVAPADRPLPLQKRPLAEDSFTQELSALITEANGRLQALLPSPNRRTPVSLASLPLYIVMGGEGAGKTTLLLNSGLEPRLLAGEAARDGDTLPTRLANLWLAEGAVFAEISGRILLQDPDHWEKALRLLSAERSLPAWKRFLHGDPGRTNLQGVLLACDTKLFLRANDLQRLSSLARTFNDRLATITTVFRKEFPVYVLLTHCDTVQYFPEFFAHLSESESRRPLGASLTLAQPEAESADVYSDREGRRLTGFFNRLYQSLADKRLNLLAREEDPAKRALAYEFPRELKKLRGDLVQFLLDTFRPSTPGPGFRLRGFFFAGRRLVARTGMDLDASVANSVVRRPADATVFFGSQSGSKPGINAGESSVFVRRTYSAAIPRWAFLTELFHDLILGDRAGDAAPATSSPYALYRTLAFAGAGALCLLFSLLWVNSWRNNHALLDTVEAAVAATPLSTPPSGGDAVAQLESIRPVLVRLHDDERSGPPLSYRWGLYAGAPAREALDQLYFDRFRSALLNPLLASMTERMLALDPGTPAGSDVHALIKSYRSLTSRACVPDPAVLNATVYPLWRAATSPDPSISALADRQIAFYLSELNIADPYARRGDRIPENHQAVARAQSYLQTLGGPEKIFHALVSQVDSKGTPDHLTDYAGDYTQVLTGPNELETAFTAGGWASLQDNLHSHKLLTTGEPCVVGSSSGATNWGSDSVTEASVARLYSQAYVQHWKDFLAAHHVVPFNGPVDASQKLRVLADNNRSPLLALVYVTSANTNVAPPQSVSDQFSTNVRDVAVSTQKSVQKIVNRFSGHKDSPESTTTSTGPAPAPPSTVLTEFAPVRAMVDPTSREKWLNDKNAGYMKSLEELSTSLSALPPRIDSGTPTEVAALEHANASLANANLALHTLEGSFPNTPQGIDVDLRNLLREPLNFAARTLHEIVVVKTAPATLAVAGAAAAPPAAPAGPSPHDLARPVIEQVNTSERDLCSALGSASAKYPFDASATQDATLEDLDGVFSSGSGALTRFSTAPDVSKAYVHQGRLWTAKPDFPATFSQPFLNELNSLGQMSDTLYGEGGSHAHVEYTITLDGTGKIPFELEVDGHTLKYTPGKQGIPTHLVWPPLTGSPTRLVVHTGSKGGLSLPVQSAGPWSLHHLLQNADDQSGNVFTFRAVEFAHSHIPLMNDKGTPGTLQIRVDSPAGNLFGRGYFARLRCESSWAVH